MWVQTFALGSCGGALSARTFSRCSREIEILSDQASKLEGITWLRVFCCQVKTNGLLLVFRQRLSAWTWVILHRGLLLQSPEVVKHGVTTKSWWDTVDIFAASSMSPYLLACGDGYPSTKLLQEMDKWAVSDNLWLRRTAILCQLKNKGKTDLKRLESYISSNASHKDFFVRKAIGWALREYAKHDSKWVKQFLHRYKDQLSGLSVREASLHLKA